MSKEKRMLGNYEITQSIYVGDKEVVFGVDTKDPHPFMVCYCDYHNPLSAAWPTEGVASDDYLEAMQIFVDRVQSQIDRTKEELSNYCTEYGFRVDTEKHAFLLRCNPTKGDYNFYCYCYVKEWLDKHIQKAEQGIRFIDPQYKELFRIPDGGKVIVTTSWGEKREYPCRFIDEYHTEVGSNLYHICEFAERMQKNGATYEPKPAEQTPQKTPKHKDLER